METGVNKVCAPRFRLLDDRQIIRIHHAVLRILEETGVRIHHREAVELLNSHGARVKGMDTVRIPGWMVEGAIASAPKNLVIYNREKEPAMELGGRRTWFGTGTDLPKTIDLDTRKIRDTTADDVVTAAIISDAMPNIDFIGSYGLPRDVRPGLHYIRCFQLDVVNSKKPVFFTAESLDDLEIIVEMARTIAGGMEELAEKPFIINYSEPVSPLTHPEDSVSKLMYCARNRLPINYTPAMMAGSTGPATLAGALAAAAAEALSGLVIHQLTRKGAPIISGVAATIMDMLTGSVSYTAPEFRLTHSAYADLFHHYGLPIWGTAGCSDAHFPDLQAGAEYGFTLFNAALDGANLIHDCGYLGQGFVAAPEMIVFANEVIDIVKRYMKGFEIDEDHLAMEVIHKVGPGGHFIGEKHTLDFFQEEHWRPAVFNRENLEGWIGKGKKTVNDRLIEKARRILESHKPAPLPEKKKTELEKIWKGKAASHGNR